MGTWKKYLSVCLALFCSALQAFPEKEGVIRLREGNNEGFRIVKQTGEVVEIDFLLSSLITEEFVSEKESFTRIGLTGFFLPNEAGAPDLPATGRFIAISSGCFPVVEILTFEADTLHGMHIPPAMEIPYEKGPLPMARKKNPDIYNSSAPYPSAPVTLSEPYSIRGVDAVMLGISPFAYFPLTQTLVVYHRISLRITFNGGKGIGANPKYRSRSWDPLLQNLFLNAASLPEADYGWMYDKGVEGCEYLIVATDKPEFLAWADSLKQFRTAQGIITKVIPVSEIGNTVYDLKTFFSNAYYNWQLPPSAVLLLGDYDNGTDGITSSLKVQTETGRYATDNEFADVNGDGLPDMAFARITAGSVAELETMVKKVLRYERHPPENPGYYNHPVSAMGWETSRWFQLCSEVIFGFWEHTLGKQPVRENCIFYGTPGGPWSTAPNTQTVVDYFGPGGLEYIPGNTAHLTDWDGSAQRINNDLNNGAFMLQHRDHGFVSGWGEPAYTTYDILSLFNEDLTYVFSVNCLTGKFNHEFPSFAEVFHHHTWGALGIIAATKESFSFVNDTYVWGLYDYMWPDFMPDYGAASSNPRIIPCFASVNGKYFLEQSAWPYNTYHKKVTYDLFHCHGDAFTTVYSEMPQPLTILHDSIYVTGTDTLSVQADAGAVVAVSCNGEIVSVTEGTGSPQQIPLPHILPGNKLLLCITKQNYYRYEKLIDVIPPDGPFVMAYSCSIDDPEGNGNGIAEAGEDIFLTLTLKNAGSNNADNVHVTIFCTHQDVMISDSTAFYGDINSGEFASVVHGFSLKTEPFIPDKSRIGITVEASSGSVTWISSFSIDIHAPVLSRASVRLDDRAGNNNGIFEPGENAMLTYSMANTGSGYADKVVWTISSPSPYLVLPHPVDTIKNIYPSDTATAKFFLSLSAGFTGDPVIPLFVVASCANSSLTDTIHLYVDMHIENWETGNFDLFQWQSGGDAPWSITPKEAYQDRFAATSGYIIDQQESFLFVDHVCATDDSISFFLKVSSEANWDFLRFYIDSVMIDQWSGETGWIRAAFPVPAGVHRFEWRYVKDMFVWAGRDRAMLDNIEFPPEPYVYAGMDTTTCEDVPFQLNGKAGYYNSVQWSSSGDGAFEDPVDLITIYYPGDNDITSGSVRLSLTITHDYGVLSDTMQLSFSPLPHTPVVPSGDTVVCSNTSSGYSAQAVPFAQIYGWRLQPPGAGTLIPQENMCEIFWNSGFSGTVHLSVCGWNACGNGGYSDELAISVVQPPNVTLEPFETVFIHTPPFELTGGLPFGGSYSGNGVYNGFFYPLVAGTGTHLTTYLFTDSYGCVETAEQPIVVESITEISQMRSEEFAVVPNPSDGLFCLYAGEFRKDGFIIEVYDGSQRLVYQKRVQAGFPNGAPLPVDLTKCAPGIYFYKMYSGTQQKFGKLIIQ